MTMQKEAVTYDGKVWGFPQMYEWWGVLYNKDLLKKQELKKCRKLLMR